MDLKDLIRLKEDKDSQIEIFKTTSKTTTIDVRNEKIESFEATNDGGIAIRVIKNNKLGFAFTTDFEEENLQQTLELAFSLAKNNSEDLFYSIPQPKPFTPMVTYNREISEVPFEEKVKLALLAEKSAFSHDKRIKKTEKISYMDSETKVELLNSSGFYGVYNVNYYGVSCDVIALQDKACESGSYFKISNKIDNGIFEKTGIEAAKKACELLGASTIESQKLPVVFDPFVGAQFLSSIFSFFSSDAVQKGKSLLAKKLNQKIGPNNLSIVDNGKLKEGLMTTPFDDEGVPTQENYLVKNGGLLGFLYNNYTAAKERKSSTGSARRSSYKALPDVSPTNFYINPGDIRPDDIIKKLKKAVYITRVMGLHTINPISGDFSLGISGVMIENGIKTHAVSSITIAGNLIELLQSIEEVGNDLTFFLLSANFGCPTLLIGNIAISG